MPLLFISDLHLSPACPKVTQALLLFLKQRATSATALYILGDLFDAWVGDDDKSDWSIEIQQSLLALTRSGVPLYIQHGNRDFLLGKQFMLNTGATLLADECIIEHGAHRALIMHGDTLCTDDLDYQRFRRKARNPIYQWLLKRLSLSLRKQLAAKWRTKSTMANNGKSNEIMDVNNKSVDLAMQKYDVSTLIHGHTHRPNRHNVNGGERIVLGDWHDSGWVLHLDKDGYDLQSFAI